eukprot:TRINITY_DN8739_c0_g1_i1.p1 TRINITY_DN8739_c0_g1~~TRINITY_DN8739_c0_g1_i1.p1  ORF type:complete len:204 (-),score=35.24 TRINITY_DN8739_c0_g1_i1:66-653(-)
MAGLRRFVFALTSVALIALALVLMIVFMALPSWSVYKNSGALDTEYKFQYGLARLCSSTTVGDKTTTTCGHYVHQDNKSGKQVRAAGAMVILFSAFAMLFMVFHAIWAILTAIGLTKITSKIGRVPRFLPGILAMGLVFFGLILYCIIFYTAQDWEGNVMPGYCFYFYIGVALFLILPASILFPFAGSYSQYSAF